ncbi:hypothetical protein Ddc_10278 [Ditylenchus destructor]|nr:hypothetical protein Ddc_10278 [Ditylenchus destructor]
MAGWSCGWADGSKGEWTPGESAYVLEYSNGSYTKCSHNTPCATGFCHRLWYRDEHGWQNNKVDYGCCNWKDVRA